MQIGAIREELNAWIAMGFGLLDLIPGGAAALKLLLSVLPHEVKREWTDEKIDATIKANREIRAANDAERNKRRTDQTPPEA